MTDDGGPAFPTMQQCGESGEYWMEPVGGMSLRDYFAGKAMYALVAYGGNKDEFIKMAYEIADKMIEERSK